MSWLSLNKHTLKFCYLDNYPTEKKFTASIVRQDIRDTVLAKISLSNKLGSTLNLTRRYLIRQKMINQLNQIKMKFYDNKMKIYFSRKFTFLLASSISCLSRIIVEDAYL